jgi:hypothetical protein
VHHALEILLDGIAWIAVVFNQDVPPEPGSARREAHNGFG